MGKFGVGSFELAAVEAQVFLKTMFPDRILERFELEVVEESCSFLIAMMFERRFEYFPFVAVEALRTFLIGLSFDRRVGRFEFVAAGLIAFMLMIFGRGIKSGMSACEAEASSCLNFEEDFLTFFFFSILLSFETREVFELEASFGLLLEGCSARHSSMGDLSRKFFFGSQVFWSSLKPSHLTKNSTASFPRKTLERSSTIFSTFQTRLPR